MAAAHLEDKRGKMDVGLDVTGKVVVAVKASKEISRSALVWALTHVAQPGDCIMLLVVVPSQCSGRKLWGFPRFAGDCASGHKRSQKGATLELKLDIVDACSQMMHQLNNAYDTNKINVRIKVVSGSPCGAVALESKRAQASWVVLDKQLNQEEKRCMEELQCNIVVMKRSQPKVLRLNLVGSSKLDTPIHCPLPSNLSKASSSKPLMLDIDSLSSIQRFNANTPISSPEEGMTFTSTEVGTPSVSSSDPSTSPFLISDLNGYKKNVTVRAKDNRKLYSASTDSDGNHPDRCRKSGFQPWVASILRGGRQSSKKVDIYQRCNEKAKISTTQALLQKFSKLDMEAGVNALDHAADFDCNVNNIEAIPLPRTTTPSGPPPLCSICQHKAPVFGKPPRLFSYAELELATGGFSQANFLAEGGYGSVHRGVLPDGQAIAVKQHKLASSQGDQEFCSEVEVLSCAQHRNVVMLIGFCVENQRRLLVYEYICNGSLDSHLYGSNRQPLEWSARQKIAVGAARGLRYLHEECRVGCIVHRDMRPNNILITHDFEPLVGDFGLARWQPDGDLGVETRVIGTFGYLAPEYAQSGQVTEKTDVYSFGVVLVELVTGRKAVDGNRPKGQQCLTEWVRPLLDEHDIGDLLDPRLGDRYSKQEVNSMLHAASLCIRRDPHFRPRMSQVLRLLEGDMMIESNFSPNPENEMKSRSARTLVMPQLQPKRHSSPIKHEHSETIGGRFSYGVLRTPDLQGIKQENNQSML